MRRMYPRVGCLDFGVGSGFSRQQERQGKKGKLSREESNLKDARESTPLWPWLSFSKFLNCVEVLLLLSPSFFSSFPSSSSVLFFGFRSDQASFHSYLSVLFAVLRSARSEAAETSPECSGHVGIGVHACLCGKDDRKKEGFFLFGVVSLLSFFFCFFLLSFSLYSPSS